MEFEDERISPFRPQNRDTSESKLRRNPKHCALCLKRLVRIATRGRLRKSCVACSAHVSLDKRCRRCSATGQIWENKQGAACQACGLHGRKSDVIDPEAA